MEVILLRHPTEEDWMECKRRALVTMGKDVKNPPDDIWKEKMLRSRHSPIRYLQFSFYLKDIPYFSSVHLCRHVHLIPYVKSQRNDRQNEYDRTKAPQDSPVNMIIDCNAEEFMTVCNKRLCYKADKVTRTIVQMMHDCVAKSNPEFVPFMVPNCRYLKRCPEFEPCEFDLIRDLDWKVDEAEDIRE